MAAFVVRHNDRAIFDALGKMPTCHCWCHRVPFIAKDQQTPYSRQSFRTESVDEFKLLLKVGLSSDGLMRLHFQAPVSCQVKHPREMPQTWNKVVKVHHGVAEVTATSQEYTVTDAGITLRSNNRNKAAQRIADHCVLIRGKAFGSFDDAIGGLMDEEAKFTKRHRGQLEG